jgi:hypothetical protein
MLANFGLSALLGMPRHHLHEEKNYIGVIQKKITWGKPNKKTLEEGNRTFFFARGKTKYVHFAAGKGPLSLIERDF